MCQFLWFSTDLLPDIKKNPSTSLPFQKKSVSLPHDYRQSHKKEVHPPKPSARNGANLRRTAEGDNQRAWHPHRPTAPVGFAPPIRHAHILIGRLHHQRPILPLPPIHRHDVSRPQGPRLQKYKRSKIAVYNRIIYGILYRRTFPAIRFGFTDEVREGIKKNLEKTFNKK